jgi:hypothetical protein
MVVVMLSLAVLAVLGEENLLANPGFEQLRGDMPARWNLFVEPMEGAYGKLDAATVHEGRFSAMLHNPRAYEREPVNNWSQSIIEELGGRTVRVTGAIRTRDATEAALWLQCWTRRPARVVRFATTGADQPRSGTTPWTRVSMDVEIPEGTDFLMLRCILKGHGTAWFDSVAVEGPSGLLGADLATLEPDESAATDATTPSAPSADRRAPMASADELAEAQRKLAQAQRALYETQQQLRNASDASEARLDALRNEVKALRREVREAARVRQPVRPEPPTPPLVPYTPSRAGDPRRETRP